MDLADRILTLIGISAALALVAPRPLRRALDGGLKLAGWFGRAPRLWVSMVGVVGFLAPFLGAHYVRWPVPSIHDEFAYLLTAETFASGRAAMPTHPFWEHFETYHVIHQPTYAAKYPPGLALPFALGEALFDEPRYGLWLQGGALAAAVAWMLFGWLSPRLAVIGSLLAVGRYTLAGPWVQTFYNGALAGIGGALALGALGRLLRRPADTRVGLGIALGAGFGLLAATRPFEGLVLAVPCAVVLCAWLGRRLRAGQGRATLRVLAPAAAVVVAAIGGILLYNRAVTGDPLRLPYTEYDHQYSVYPPFLWQAKAPEPEFRHPVLREFALGFQAGDYGAWGDARQMAWLVGERGYELARDFAGWPLFILCAAYLLRPRGQGVRFLAIVGVCVFAARRPTSSPVTPRRSSRRWWPWRRSASTTCAKRGCGGAGLRSVSLRWLSFSGRGRSRGTTSTHRRSRGSAACAPTSSLGSSSTQVSTSSSCASHPGTRRTTFGSPTAPTSTGSAWSGRATSGRSATRRWLRVIPAARSGR